MPDRDSLTACLRTVPVDRQAIGLSVAVGLVAGAVAESLPWVGGDLVAQRWWESWAASAGGQPVDLGWYAGSPAVSYSLLAPWVLTLVGPAAAGVVSTALGTWATTALLIRAHAPRPRAAALLAALMFTANQLSGRTTFAMGTAVGLVALLVAGSRTRSRSTTWARRATATLLAVLAGGLSPIAAVFLGLAAAAWWVAGGTRSPAASPGAASGVPGTSKQSPEWTMTLWRVLTPPPGRAIDAALLLVGVLVPLLVMVLLGAASGPMPSSAHQMLGAVLAVALVVATVGRDQALIRAGAGLTGALLLTAWVLPDPLGSNATRLVLVFAAPVLVATARWDRVVVGLSVAMVTWLLPPLVPADLAPRDATAEKRTSAPLLTELARRAPLGRVEVVPLADHQDATLAEQVPLARGWTRQLDVGRNPVFYDGSLDAASYLGWLRARGVSYVALSVRPPDWAARAEAALVRAGVPGLTRVWSDDTWSLYVVDGPGVVLDGPATVTGSDRRALTVDVSESGAVELAIFWDERLTLVGDGCLAPGPTPGTVLLRASAAGSFSITSGWRSTGHC